MTVFLSYVLPAVLVAAGGGWLSAELTMWKGWHW